MILTQSAPSLPCGINLAEQTDRAAEALHSTHRPAPHDLISSLLRSTRNSHASSALLAMRSIFGILLLLLGIGLFSVRIEGRSAENRPAHQPIEWVRTVDGWERPYNNWRPSLAAPPAVHPLIVAAAQTLISLFALAAAATPRDGKTAGQ